MKSRAIILVTVLTLLTVKSFSQNGFNTESKDSTNIYYYSLIKYCDYLDKQKENTNIIYVEKNFLFTDDLPDKIRNYEIKYLDGLDVKNHLKGKKSMRLVRIISLRVKGDDFFVNVIPFGVSYKKKSFKYANGGGLGVKFLFDKTINRLTFKSAEMGGI